MVLTETLIEAENVGRKFARNWNIIRKYGLRQAVHNLLGRPWKEGELLPGEFWALKDVSFKLQRGESVGIMGLNGAGKSTLLKIIAGLLLPSRGAVRVRGTLDSLIELGTGFHPALSGRENVFIRCAFKGMPPRKTRRVFEEIVEFAELEEFIDMPFTNYSSGMKARLGFATAIFGNPDILIVDEVLSVGDFTFRQKCLDRMNRLKERSAILFVSHAFSAVRMFCDRGIVLHHGAKIYDGTVEDAIEVLRAQEEIRRPQKGHPALDAEEEDEERGREVWGPVYHNPEKVTDVRFAWTDEDGNETDEFFRDRKICLQYSFRLLYRPNNLLMGIPLWNSKDEMITAFASDVEGVRLRIGPDGEVRGRVEIDSPLNRDRYYGVLAICDGPEFISRSHLPPLTVTGAHGRLYGSVRVPHRWVQETPGAEATPSAGQ